MARKHIIASAVAVWLVAVGFGVELIYSYSTTPGARAPAPDRWPTESGLPATGDRVQIVLFAHPECPCTRASLHELAEIANRAGGRAQITVVLSGPGATWDAAGEVPGVRRVLDPLQVEARRFGARTSGHVVVYDAGGALRYAGGITGSRGHVGDNAGRDIVQRIVTGSDEHDLRHAVFGCAL